MVEYSEYAIDLLLVLVCHTVHMVVIYAKLGVEVKLIRKKNPVIATSTPTQLGVFSSVSTGFAVFRQLSWCRFGGLSVSFFCKHRPDSAVVCSEQCSASEKGSLCEDGCDAFDG